ncbi:MAG: bifunctional pyr operon transcriptional regulator/uracil phosphoribosyltransferase PyrR [Chitinophagaceae bacterium]|nr:bifunctional pyr operon transcriptional regulator/uracil phosphoribosyltransferase PyrR [Chitinophagaceae bacterium]NBY24738.1 bifunctional pyr operon transcriptional regulator/uracil phosphoribosyltransferase PyrR [Chitinophagaceae bacterium]NCW88286.1 bifunctional pyr operon transcriptional regulator/uracil phosphoribosyltransferase PyrR [Chitinophagia bacterium]NDE78273.1 bifunctional pyr operon transcriptional regulator/uracil phosphoribosyltransferase PyrR [Chitinophagaceae bacterium]
MKVIVQPSEVYSILKQLGDQLLQKHPQFENTVLIGIQQGGAVVSSFLHNIIASTLTSSEVLHGQLDITFYRDDVRNKIVTPDKMNLPFSIEGKTVILVDDVLFTGRTIKAALDALLDYGRPERVELCVLIDRHEHRQFPIQPDYSGKKISTLRTEKIKLMSTENGDPQVILINQ